MGWDLYSERQRRMKAAPDVLVYDALEEPARVKINFAIQDLLAPETSQRHQTEERYKLVVHTLRREFGMQRLSEGRNGVATELWEFVRGEPSVARILDVIEAVMRVAIYCHQKSHHRIDPTRFLETINDTFRRHAVGYQLEGDETVRVDNTYAHAVVTQPALTLLASARWQGADEEFLKAHEHYRDGNNKEAITEAAKSFESVMKTICLARGWAVDPNATSKALLDACFKNDLVPPFWQTQMGALRALLEGSVPTGRNKRAAHGQGAAPVAVPDELAGYVMHMAAAAIIFLVKADAALGP
jgi:hypothetical protein